jgi:asparagine synthase (glutamine-hydrolysing)
MAARLAHRGPDGDGLHVDGEAALGHRRLAIVDLAGGAQPMSNEDGTVWVTYNGELYGEPALRAELEGKGHRYRTTCDTETLVHLYEEEGPGFAARLNGMFALAMWDARRRRLVLARDRMGQKPLYHAGLPGGGIAFASEPKALFEHPDVPRRLDEAGLARYLFYEYLPAPHSIWAGVGKLPPGHVLVWERGHAVVERYWTPAGVEPGGERVTGARRAEGFWEAFRGAVDRHRRADVPIGVFLSGGVDSSSVAAAVCQLEPARGVQTFSVGFEDRSFDESAHARRVAAHLGTEHHERIFSARDVLDLLPEVEGWLDEPFGDASVLPTHLLSRFARERVKVVLGGDGADELLAGYPTFAAEQAARWFVRLPGAARSLAAGAVERLPVDHRNFSLDFKLKQFLRGATEASALAHQRWLGSFSGAEIAGLLANRPAVDVEAEHLERAAGLRVASGRMDALTRSLLLYQDTYLPEDILFKVDRSSMACGLEVRAPLLDAELVAGMQALPSDLKLRGGVGKWLLKRAARPHLPAETLRRAKKGFGIPVAKWLRGPLGGMLDELLGADRLRSQGVFRPEAVGRLVAEHRAGTHDHRKPLWTLLVFQMWHRRWVESE